MADDAAIARRAARQQRVVSGEQLAEAGFTWNAIAHRLKHGSLQRLWRGVYLVGPGKPDQLSLAMAAILTCGDAVISHRWAGRQWRFIDAAPLPVDVIVASGSHRGRAEVQVHRTILLDPRDFTTHDGIPITSPARTLLDLASVVTTNVLECAIAEAQVLQRVNARHLRDVIARSGRHPGAAKLARALEAGPDLTRSEAERILRRLLKQAGLAEPRTNQRVNGYEVDFYFPSHAVIVEVDGYGPHSTRRAFERDHKKRTQLATRAALGRRPGRAGARRGSVVVDDFRRVRAAHQRLHAVRRQRP